MIHDAPRRIGGVGGTQKTLHDAGRGDHFADCPTMAVLQDAMYLCMFAAPAASSAAILQNVLMPTPFRFAGRMKKTILFRRDAE